MNNEIDNALAAYAATKEVHEALTDGYRRGILAGTDLDDADAVLRWWRTPAGQLCVTEKTVILPSAKRVYLRWEKGAGWEVDHLREAEE